MKFGNGERASKNTREPNKRWSHFSYNAAIADLLPVGIPHGKASLAVRGLKSFYTTELASQIFQVKFKWTSQISMLIFSLQEQSHSQNWTPGMQGTLENNSCALFPTITKYRHWQIPTQNQPVLTKARSHTTSHSPY